MDNMQLFSAPGNLDVDGALKLLEAVGLPMESGSVIAVKVDFTKPCPPCLPVICDALREKGCLAFLADTAPGYGDALKSLWYAPANGYDRAGAPCVLADGVKGTDYELIPAKGVKLLRSAKFGRAILDADAILSVTELMVDESGYYGVIYDLGFGCASRAGKTEVQTSGKPVVDQSKCIGCKQCTTVCEHGGARMEENGKATIFPPKCSGCSRCMRICPTGAIHPNFDVTDASVQSKIAEYAKALCDMRPHAHLMMAAGTIYACADPVQLDKVCAEALGIPSSLTAGIEHLISLREG